MAMSNCIISPPGAMCWQRRPGRKAFDPATLASVEAFLDAPLEWSAQHGGVSELPA
jgi:hypothetical protein